MNKNYVSFSGANEKFGGLSNIAESYPFMINKTRIPTSEHLYQALKFPDHPEIQRKILSHSSPVLAKRVSGSKENKPCMRSDWESIQLDVMAYCLRVKLVWNWVSFGQLLESTGDLDIYAISSKKDQFWGFIPGSDGDDQFKGKNHLGLLLTELRNQYIPDENQNLHLVEAPEALQLCLLGENLKKIDRRPHLLGRGTRTTWYVNQFRF